VGWRIKSSDPIKFVSENIDFEKLNFMHAKITVIKNMFDKKYPSPIFELAKMR